MTNLASGAGIQTHDLLDTSLLPQPLDQGQFTYLNKSMSRRAVEFEAIRRRLRTRWPVHISGLCFRSTCEANLHAEIKIIKNSSNQVDVYF